MPTTTNFDATKELLHNSDFYYIICTDNYGNYSYINNRYANSFKYINTHFVGQPYHITMHPDDTKVCEEVGAQCYANPGKLFPATLRKHNGQGGYIVTQWEFTLILENNEPQGIFCLGHDITEYVAVKNEVESINKDLDSKNDLLNTIAFEQSHLVRAPLANIIGLVSILKNLNLGASTASIIGMLDKSSAQLDNVIKHIVGKTEG